MNLFAVGRFIVQFLKVQNHFNTQFIDTYLQPFYMQFKRELKDSTLRKIKKYYCLGIPLSIAGYAKLYGRNCTEKERELATLLGIMIPLIDDFTDNKTLDREAIDKLMSSSSEYESKTLEEAIVKSILNYLLVNVKDADVFLYSIKKLVQAQHWSQRQMEPGVPRNELREISLDKGGWSHVLFHYVMVETPTEQTINTLYLMGGMLQMCNDVFDVHKDHMEGIATFANSSDNFKKFEEYYLEECRNFVRSARALPFMKEDKEKFISIFVCILARGVVAIRMLEKLQKKMGGGVLPIALVDRKELICDMEKPMNLFRMMRFIYWIK